MNLLSKKFIATLRGIKLSATERARMKDALMSHMVLSPISIKSSLATPKHRRIFTRRTFRRTLPITLIIALLAGAGVSYAAERTLPGDKLYPIKIHVNESVRRTLAVGDHAKAEAEVNFATRRLNEAVALEEVKRLDDTTKHELKQQFDAHKKSLTARIKNIEKRNKKDAEKITKELEGLLGTRKDTLRSIGIQSGENDDDHDDKRGRGGDDDKSRSLNSHEESKTTATSSQVREQNDDRRAKKDTRKESRGRDHDEDDAEDDDWDDRTNRGAQPTPPPATTTSATASTTGVTFTRSQIATHNTAQSCHTTIGGNVYDITSYIDIHKGGRAQILAICGKDGSSLFAGQHNGQPKPEQALASFNIGKI